MANRTDIVIEVSLGALKSYKLVKFVCAFPLPSAVSAERHRAHETSHAGCAIGFHKPHKTSLADIRSRASGTGNKVRRMKIVFANTARFQILRCFGDAQVFMPPAGFSTIVNTTPFLWDIFAVGAQYIPH